MRRQSWFSGSSEASAVVTTRGDVAAVVRELERVRRTNSILTSAQVEELDDIVLAACGSSKDKRAKSKMLFEYRPGVPGTCMNAIEHGFCTSNGCKKQSWACVVGQSSGDAAGALVCNNATRKRHSEFEGIGQATQRGRSVCKRDPCEGTTNGIAPTATVGTPPCT